jgi:hypothetical protein
VEVATWACFGIGRLQSDGDGCRRRRDRTVEVATWACFGIGRLLLTYIFTRESGSRMVPHPYIFLNSCIFHSVSVY